MYPMQWLHHVQHNSDLGRTPSVLDSLYADLENRKGEANICEALSPIICVQNQRKLRRLQSSEGHSHWLCCDGS